MRRSNLLVLAVWLMASLTLTGGAFAASSKSPTGSGFVASPKNIQGIDAGDLLKRIADASGKVVVVNVFASWCPPCREEIPGLINVRKVFSE